VYAVNFKWSRQQPDGRKIAGILTMFLTVYSSYSADIFETTEFYVHNICILWILLMFNQDIVYLDKGTHT